MHGLWLSTVVGPSQDMGQHDREGILAGLLPDATAKMLAVMPQAMAIDALQTLIPPIAQQVLRLHPHSAACVINFQENVMSTGIGILLPGQSLIIY